MNAPRLNWQEWKLPVILGLGFSLGLIPSNILGAALAGEYGGTLGGSLGIGICLYVLSAKEPAMSRRKRILALILSTISVVAFLTISFSFALLGSKIGFEIGGKSGENISGVLYGAFGVLLSTLLFLIGTRVRIIP